MTFAKGQRVRSRFQTSMIFDSRPLNLRAGAIGTIIDVGPEWITVALDNPIAAFSTWQFADHELTVIE